MTRMDDFPAVEDLPVYGVDVPVPVSESGLPCEYNWGEGMGLADLEGYRVPPEGIIKVTKAGGGIKGGKGGFVYGPGTFFEDKYTIGKELGATHAQMMEAREQAQLDGFTNGALKFLEEKGIDLDSLNMKAAGPKVIEALVYWSLKMIDEERSPREANKFLESYWKKITQKGDAIQNQRLRQTRLTADEAEQWINLYREAQSIPTINVIEGDIVDIEE